MELAHSYTQVLKRKELTFPKKRVLKYMYKYRNQGRKHQ